MQNQNQEQPNSSQIIQARFLALPKTIQDAITNSGWEEKLRRIVDKHNLLLDQGIVIENTVFMSMLGIINPNSLVSELSSEGIKREVAVDIVNDVNKEIFSSIKTELVSTFEKFEVDEPEIEEEKPLAMQSNYNTGLSNNDRNINNNADEEDFDLEEREDILKQIEDQEEPEETKLLEENTYPDETPLESNQNDSSSQVVLQEKSEAYNPGEIVNPVFGNLVTESNSKNENISLNKDLSSANLKPKIDPYREPVE